MSSLRTRVALLLSVAALAGSGCGGTGTPSVSSSSEEATVKGTVAVRGKPATKGEITFDPTNINRRKAPVAKATIEKDGSYTLKTLVGENSVSVTNPQIVKDPGMSMNRQVI